MIHVIEIKDGRAWMTITAESYDEWIFLLKLWDEILLCDETVVVVMVKDETARQVSLRISEAENRQEEEEYYWGK